MQPTKSSDKYVEGTTELVEKVTFLPGFQFYATSVDIWGTSWTMDDITLIPHAVIKTELTLENVNYGMGWVRELKKDGDSGKGQSHKQNHCRRRNHHRQYAQQDHL